MVEAPALFETINLIDAIIDWTNCAVLNIFPTGKKKKESVLSTPLLCLPKIFMLLIKLFLCLLIILLLLFSHFIEGVGSVVFGEDLRMIGR